ncbi:MAG: radical SAM protein [Candidatus Aenigmarchaeota archaeon]|nr:radical SAM protein [Candidatus Aenigmarchaeota archaeon]
MLAYGPVPSRRLGKSIGINHIPPKICSYSCIYCQLGKTIQTKVNRRKFYSTEKIFDSVKSQIEKAANQNEQVDYLTFVPDGEPTLDINLGREIESVKSLGKKVAVIQNSSLLWREDVRRDLMYADWVSVKVDAVSSMRWGLLNRPHRELQIDRILQGVKDFAEEFKGELTTETMLVRNYNDDTKELEKIANFIKNIRPDMAYISIPTRPPAEKFARSPIEKDINEAFQIFKSRLRNVEYLIGYEGDEFAYTGDIERDLLSITSVHPMREDGVKKLLSKANSDWEIIDRLIEDKKILELDYKNRKFYMRKIPSRN